jgi:hypothetical protein
LNPRFFKLKAGPYASLNKADYELEPSKMAAHIQVSPLETKMLDVQAADTLYLKVLIENQNSKPIPSNLSSNTFLSYHWLRDGEVIEWDGLRTSFEVDVWHAFVQDIQLHTPSTPGLYSLQFDIVIEGQEWFGLNEQYQVLVENP